MGAEMKENRKRQKDEEKPEQSKECVQTQLLRRGWHPLGAGLKYLG